MSPYEPVKLLRRCDAILIPHGTPIEIDAGMEVYITQALGGSVTVNVNGNLARIAAKDLDALGMEPEAESANAGGSADQSAVSLSSFTADE